MLSEEEQSAIMHGALELVKTVAPIDTGNLRRNAVTLENKGNGKWEIVVKTKIAPYMPYTNEPWISPKWNGKKNPNEGWFDSVAELVAIYITQELGGEFR